MHTISVTRRVTHAVMPLHKVLKFIHGPIHSRVLHHLFIFLYSIAGLQEAACGN